jgi:putative tryptophan/tyrosine transport system substrate-binding protein
VLPETVTLPELEPLPPPKPPVAVVLSADTEHYRSVADALGEGRWRRFVLADGDAARVLEALREDGIEEAIAIGHQALALLAATGLDVAYCQVFEAAAEEMSGHRGVAPLPAYGAQLDAWRSRDPELHRIGLITGPDHTTVAATVESAAADRGITVHRAVARSDRELLYVFRRMVPDIDGFLLYPDTSILSPRAIRELLAYAAKHDVDVLTYNRAVFELGAALLVSADPAEVARQVVAALSAEDAAGELPLTQVVVESADPARGGAR